MRRVPIPTTTRARLLLALAGGVLYAASLPPLGAWPLAWIALAPLLLGCVGLRAGGAAGVGLVFGLVAASLSSPWFPGMIGDYFDQPGPLVWPLAVIAWTLCGAGYVALFAGWLGWAARRGAVSPLLVGAAWSVGEWARANAMIANPWALLGYSQMGFLPVAQAADLAGPYGIGALLAATAAAVTGLLAPGRSAGRDGVAVAIVIALTLVYGGYRLAQAPEEGEVIRAALVQGALPRKQRSDPSDAAANLEHHLALTTRAADGGIDLVLWPELALDFYVEQDHALRRRLVAAIAELEIDLISGGFGFDRDGLLPTNSVFVVTGRGVRARYDKVRLMAFSESNPLPFEALGRDAMAAGQAARSLRGRQTAFGVAICSEAMHPRFVREVVHSGAEVLVTPTIDSWFGSTGGKRQQLEAVAMRAIETRRYVLRPTATGITALIDPRGRIVASAAPGVPTTLAVSFSPRREITPYVRLGDVGVALGLALLAIDSARRIRRGCLDQPEGSASDQAAAALA